MISLLPFCLASLFSYFFFILGFRKCSAFPNLLASCFCIFTHAALYFVQKSFPAGKHLSFKIQLKLYLFLEAFSDSFFIQQTQLLTSLYPHCPCINFEALVCFSPLQGNNLFDSKDCV